MRRHTTSEVLMVRPICFEYNPETAVNNSFQIAGDTEQANKLAVTEFDNYVKLLEDAGVRVVVIQDTIVPHTPDSIFPNNWFTTHSGEELIFYPLFAKNRRTERKETPTSYLKLRYKNLYDFTKYEKKGKYLEGTGSLILDRVKKIAYVCRAERSDPMLMTEFCKLMGYKGILFNSVDANNNPIYHTNVMMSIGTNIAFIALCTITDLDERDLVKKTIERSGKRIVELSMEQVENFAGNMIELCNQKKESILVLSEVAHKSLNQSQLDIINAEFDKLVIPNIPTIEKNGGGSARCMVAELF